MRGEAVLEKLLRKPNKVKLSILLLFGFVAVLFAWFLQQFLSGADKTFSSGADFLVWSSSDCNGVKTIQGIHSNIAWTIQRVHPVESLIIEGCDGLRYPLQSGPMVYYSTRNRASQESSIISRSRENPNESHSIENVRWDIIFSKSGDITYKRIVDDDLYYMLRENYAGRNKTGEIWRYNLTDKSDILLVENTNHKASFDVDENGRILYVNDSGEIILRDFDGNQTSFGQGTTACFFDNSQIIAVTSSKIKIISLSDKKEKSLSKLTGHEIVISPNGLYAAVREIRDHPKFGLTIDYLHVVNLSTGNVNTINVVPDVMYGIEWFVEYHIIS
jgi:hypothetical protein